MSETSDISNGLKSFIRMLFHGGAIHDSTLSSAGAINSRDDGVQKDVISRDRFGWSYLTQKGHDLAVFLGFGDEKMIITNALPPEPETPVADAAPVRKPDPEPFENLPTEHDAPVDHMMGGADDDAEPAQAPAPIVTSGTTE